MSCISKILELKGDKDFFVPEGNWIAVEGGGVYKDYEYLIVLNTNGHRCGYVALPPEHKYSATPEEQTDFGIMRKKESFWDYNKLDIQCHGGLTFMKPDHGLKAELEIPCNDMWIGFDCGHCDDASDKEAFKKYFGEELYEKKKFFFDAVNFDFAEIRDFDYVKSECESIIDQLIQVAA